MEKHSPRALNIFTAKNLDKIPQIARLPQSEINAMKAVAAVLPFRINDYVVDELIDWSNIPNDPMFQLTFPQRGMLEDHDFERMLGLVEGGASAAEIEKNARDIQLTLNPHPAGQVELNTPLLNGQPLQGAQHKYKETILFFPTNGQTCHTYCTYCFRWAQFVGLEDLKFASKEAEGLVQYIKQHPEITSVLFTGGDPMVMKTKVLRRYIEPLLNSGLDHLESIRIGTKATAYWPFRFTTDDDADDLLRLFEEVYKSGRTLALMSHYSHPRELETEASREAVRRIRSTGAIIRCQAPLIRHVNDNPNVWATLWRTQLRLGAVPYYMFVERDTGAKHYFEVPLAEALEIYNDAYRQISGLCRTVRGPSMSATPGKVLVDGVCEVGGEKVFVLKFLQARDPAWVGKPFFAKFDPEATWLNHLVPAFGEKEFFFEPGMRDYEQTRASLTIRKKPQAGHESTLGDAPIADAPLAAAV